MPTGAGSLFDYMPLVFGAPLDFSSFGDVCEVDVSDCYPARQSVRPETFDASNVASMTKLELFSRRGDLHRPEEITRDDVEDLSLYGFWSLYDVRKNRLIKRQREAIVAIMGAFPASHAAVTHENHEEYARRNLYAYMLCPGLLGLDFIDDIVARFYGNSYGTGLRDFVREDNVWCPPWLRHDYGIQNLASAEAGSSANKKQSVHEPTSACLGGIGVRVNKGEVKQKHAGKCLDTPAIEPSTMTLHFRDGEPPLEVLFEVDVSDRSLTQRSPSREKEDGADVATMTKLEVFCRRADFHRSQEITREDIEGISFYAFWCSYDVKEGRLSRRRREAIVAVSGTYLPSHAAVGHENHEEYAKRNLYAYMPCAGLLGIEYIDQVVAEHYGGSFGAGLRDFVRDGNMWCPPWLRCHYADRNPVHGEAASVASQAQRVHEPAATSREEKASEKCDEDE